MNAGRAAIAGLVLLASVPAAAQPGMQQGQGSSVGSPGQRQSREQAAPSVDVGGRVSNRIQSRVDLRIRSRIDRNYRGPADASAVYANADGQARTASRQAPRR